MDFNSISQFLDLVSNPTKYQTALKELQAEKQRISDMLDTYGKIRDVKDLEILAQKKLDSAKEAIEQAKKDGEKLRADAQVAISKEWDVFNKQKEAHTKVVQETDAKLSQAQKLHLEVQETKKQAQQAKEEYEALRADNASLNVELTERLEKLRSVMGN